MNRTKIEWCDYTINPVKGLCPMACDYCYARRMYKRFKWNPEIRLNVNCFLPFLETMKRKPSRIFIGSTMELFGDWIKPEWMQFIFERVRMLPEHTFIFLTKCPQNLIKFSPFPENCWVGVTATGHIAFWKALSYLKDIKARVKYLSLEPMLESIKILPSPFTNFEQNNSATKVTNALTLAGISWLIIGSCTGTKKDMEELCKRYPNLTLMPWGKKWTAQPCIKDLREIVEAADRAGVKVFLKDNLEPLIPQERPFRRFSGGLLGNLRQELPARIGGI